MLFIAFMACSVPTFYNVISFTILGGAVIGSVCLSVCKQLYNGRLSSCFHLTLYNFVIQF